MKGILRLGFVAALAAFFTATLSYLRGPVQPRREPQEQAELERAVAFVDRELAADLELMTMFDQTRQAFVLENGQFLAARSVLEAHAAEAYGSVRDLYERIPLVEAAMERRGPAGTLADADRLAIEEWEGDAREAQRLLRSSLSAEPPRRGDRILDRVRERFASRRPGG